MPYLIFIFILCLSSPVFAYNQPEPIYESENPEMASEYNNSGDFERERQLDSFIQKGIQAHKRKDFDRAINLYTHAIRLEPNSSELFFDRGLAKSEGGYREDAARDFTQAIRLNPSSDAAYFNRGIVESEMKMYGQALRDFDKTISLVPGDAKALYNRALTKYALNDIKGALADAQKSRKFYTALRKRTEVIEITNFINSIQYPQGQYDYSAQAQYEDRPPEMPQMYYGRPRFHRNYY